MRHVYLALAAGMLALAPYAAAAQDQTPATEQLYRNINAALAQDNARLGSQVQELSTHIQRLNAELAKKAAPAPAAIPAEAEKK